MLDFSTENLEKLLLELSLGRITFLSLKEKQFLKKNLDSSHSLAILSIEDIEKITGRHFSKRVIWNGKENLRMAEISLQRCRQYNIGILLSTDSQYPELLRQISDPPYLLFYRGNVELLQHHCVSIVGTRKLSTAGKSAARQFAYDAAMDGCVVVSGLANGADGYAHLGAVDSYFDCLEKGLNVENTGRTVAVLPSAIDEVVPASHKKLAAQIIETGGLLISEYEPGMAIANWHYVGRNRIIAGLSDSTVVIEAPAGSGALITADFALENGRDVFFHEVCFSGNAKQISEVVRMQLEKDHAVGKVSRYKIENTPEKFLEAGAPVIKDYKDFCMALKELPGARAVPVQGELF